MTTTTAKALPPPMEIAAAAAADQDTTTMSYPETEEPSPIIVVYPKIKDMKTERPHKLPADAATLLAPTESTLAADLPPPQPPKHVHVPLSHVGHPYGDFVPYPVDRTGRFLVESYHTGGKGLAR